MCGVGEWVGCVARLSRYRVSKLPSLPEFVLVFFNSGWLVWRVAFFSVADTQWATPDDPLIAGTPLSLVAVCTCNTNTTCTTSSYYQHFSPLSLVGKSANCGDRTRLVAPAHPLTCLPKRRSLVDLKIFLISSLSLFPFSRFLSQNYS